MRKNVLGLPQNPVQQEEHVENLWMQMAFCGNRVPNS
jgi:hypothetical protein